MTLYVCSEPDCDRNHMARGYCGSHYQQHRKAGTLPAARPPRRERRPDALLTALGTRVTDLEIALSIAHHHAGMLLERWGHMTSDELHEHLLLLHQESKAGAVPDCQEVAS